MMVDAGFGVPGPRGNQITCESCQSYLANLLAAGGYKAQRYKFGNLPRDLEQYRERCYSYSYRSHYQSSSRIKSDIKMEIQYLKRVEEAVREIIQTKRILPKCSDLVSVP